MFWIHFYHNPQPGFTKKKITLIEEQNSRNFKIQVATFFFCKLSKIVILFRGT